MLTISINKKLKNENRIITIYLISKIYEFDELINYTLKFISLKLIWNKYLLKY